MSTVVRTDMPETQYARGALTPIVRAATHVGFILGALNSTTPEDWDANKAQINRDVRIELQEASSHLVASPLLDSANPYFSTQTTNALAELIAQLGLASLEDWEEYSALFESLTNLSHNFAYAAQLADRDTFGLPDASAGIRL